MNHSQSTRREGPDAVARTHIGHRETNEDRVTVNAANTLYVVADGVGGHQGGDVASRITCEVVADRVAAGDDLRTAILTADAAVRDAVETGEGREGMASTIVAALRQDARLIIAWVGDSRAYLWDGVRLSLITEDDSLVASLLARGQIDRNEADLHPQRHVILQALGRQHDQPIEVNVREYPEEAFGGYLLLCSDGLSDVVSPGELSAILGDPNANGTAGVADDLINAALNNGGQDNISLIIVHLGPADGSRRITADKVVWSFDPGSQVFHDGDATKPAPQATGIEVIRIQPRASRTPERSDTKPRPAKKRRLWRHAIMAILAIAIVLVAAIATGSDGPEQTDMRSTGGEQVYDARQ